MAFEDFNLQAAIIKASERFGTHENRFSEYGAWQAFRDNAALMFPPSVIEGTRNSPVQQQKILALKRGTAPVLTSRTCAITGQATDAAYVLLHWDTIGFEIKITKSLNAGSYISVEDDFAQQMANGMRAVLPRWDIACYNALEANKNTVLVDPTLPNVSVGAGKYSVSDIVKLYQSLPSIMSVNDISGEFLNIASPQAKASLLGMLTFGANNQQNQAGLLGGLPGAMGYQNYFSNRVLNAAGDGETHYFAPRGGIGMFTWNDYESKNNVTTSTGKKFYLADDNIVGATWGVMAISDCELNVNNQRVVYDSYQFTLDYALVTEYTSEAGNTPIIKAVTPSIVNI